MGAEIQLVGRNDCEVSLTLLLPASVRGGQVNKLSCDHLLSQTGIAEDGEDGRS